MRRPVKVYRTRKEPVHIYQDEQILLKRVRFGFKTFLEDAKVSVQRLREPLYCSTPSDFTALAKLVRDYSKHRCVVKPESLAEPDNARSR